MDEYAISHYFARKGSRENSKFGQVKNPTYAIHPAECNIWSLSFNASLKMLNRLSTHMLQCCRIAFSPSPSSACSANSSTSSRHTNTSTFCSSRLEHGSISQHIRNDEKANVRAADIDLVEMGDTAVASGDGDVFELDVHVVFGC